MSCRMTALSDARGMLAMVDACDGGFLLAMVVGVDCGFITLR